VSRKPGRFGELLWYRLRKHKLASVQKLFFWTRDSRNRNKLLCSFPWAELDYILLRGGDGEPFNIGGIISSWIFEKPDIGSDMRRAARHGG